MSREMDAALHRLLQLGVPQLEATALVGAIIEDPRRVLVVAPVPGEPREGDRIRATSREGGPPESLRVLVAVEIPGGERTTILTSGVSDKRRKWAMVGEPVDPSGADDIALPRGLGSG